VRCCPKDIQSEETNMEKDACKAPKEVFQTVPEKKQGPTITAKSSVLPEDVPTDVEKEAHLQADLMEAADNLVLEIIWDSLPEDGITNEHFEDSDAEDSDEAEIAREKVRLHEYLSLKGVESDDDDVYSVESAEEDDEEELMEIQALEYVQLAYGCAKSVVGAGLEVEVTSPPPSPAPGAAKVVPTADPFQKRPSVGTWVAPCSGLSRALAQRKTVAEAEEREQQTAYAAEQRPAASPKELRRDTRDDLAKEIAALLLGGRSAVMRPTLAQQAVPEVSIQGALALGPQPRGSLAQKETWEHAQKPKVKVEVSKSNSQTQFPEPKRAKRRTIFGAPVRPQPERREAVQSALASRPRTPAPSPRSSPSSASMRRSLSYCVGTPAGASRADRQTCRTKEGGRFTLRLDLSDVDEVSPPASRRESSLTNAYEALGAELHNLDSSGSGCEDNQHAIRTAHSCFSRASSDSKVGVHTPHGKRLATVPSSPLQGGSRRAGVRCSAMDLDFSGNDTPVAHQASSASTWEELLRASSCSVLPLLRSKKSGFLPALVANPSRSPELGTTMGRPARRWADTTSPAF